MRALQPVVLDHMGHGQCHQYKELVHLEVDPKSLVQQLIHPLLSQRLRWGQRLLAG